MANRQAFHGHYVVPWPHGCIVVGATRERGTGWGDHTTAAGVREVLDEALGVVPGLAHATIVDMRVDIRPATPDNLPVLGGSPPLRMSPWRRDMVRQCCNLDRTAVSSSLSSRLVARLRPISARFP